MRKLITTASITLLMGSSSVWAQEACSTYKVQAGDSLSAIAKKAYGDLNFLRIFNANREVMGNNPNQLLLGIKLNIPCKDGTLAQDKAKEDDEVEKVEEAPKAEEETKVEETTETVAKKSAPLQIRLTTASGYKPFTDEGLEGGGIYTQLVTAAAKTLEPDYKVTTTFVNDWGSHLENLVPNLAFDGAFPWTRPDCEGGGDALSDNSKWRCNDFVHTDPFYEIVNVLFVAKSGSLETTEDAKDFHGKTICLPDAYTDQSLAFLGLKDGENIELFRPVSEMECMEAILAGSIDAAALELQQGTDLTKELGATDEITMNQNLLHVQPLNVFVSKDNPNKDEIVANLNQGLKNIRDSGEWFKIVETGLNDSN